MPNTIRTQPIWLPTGNPDTTNIAAADWGGSTTSVGMGGQPGGLGQKFDYNTNEYQRVLLDSGAVAANPVGAPAANDLLFWKDPTNFIVTNDPRVAVGGSLGTNAPFNFVSGVLRNAATAGNYIDQLIQGNAINLNDGSHTFAAGETVIADASTTTGAVDRIAVGTAPTFQRLGIARGAASGGLVSVDVSIDYQRY